MFTAINTMRTGRVSTFILITFLLLPVQHAVQAGSQSTFTDPLNPDLQFMRIPDGEFLMGTVALRDAAAEMPQPDPSTIWDEAPRHKVIFDHPFYLGRTEVTQNLWLSIMNTRPGPEQHWQHPEWKRLPVTGVSWHDIQKFLDTLNHRSDKYRYRLPTEAEWEYAARTGKPGLRPFPLIELDDHAWYINTSNDEIQPVATLQPNAWGLYDMLGNVWEWVSDWYSPTTYANSRTENPQGPAEGSKKVRRGGSYHCPVHLVRPGYRSAETPDKAYSVLGFRLVVEARTPDAPEDNHVNLRALRN